jgi:hypothetical protein
MQNNSKNLKIPNFIVYLKKLQVIGNFNPIKMNFLSLANFKLWDISQDPKNFKPWNKNLKFYCKFFLLVQRFEIVKPIMNYHIFKGLHTCEFANDFFNLHKRKKEVILHINKLAIGFIYSHRWKKKIILHTWKLASGFFNSCRRKK